MEAIPRKELTIEALRARIESWRERQPHDGEKFLDMLKPAHAAIGAAFTTFFLVIAFLVTSFAELFRLLVIVPVLTVLHTAMVLVAALLLRVAARPLIRVGVWAVLNKQRRGARFAYAALPVLLRGFVHVFGPSLKFYLKIDPRDARSLGKVQDWVDDTVGVEGVWIQSDINRAIRLETWCPFAGREIPYVAGTAGLPPEKACRGDCTEFCRGFMASWLDDWVGYYNPRFEVRSTDTLIPRGDEFCEFVYSLRTDFKREP